MENQINFNQLQDILINNSKTIGKDIIKKVLEMYYVLIKPDIPIKAKSIIIGALLYLILPIDLIPDFLPGGYTDDIGAVITAFSSVFMYIDDDVRNKAENTFNKWFKT